MILTLETTTYDRGLNEDLFNKKVTIECAGDGLTSIQLLRELVIPAMKSQGYSKEIIQDAMMELADSGDF